MVGSVKNPALSVNLRCRAPRWVKRHVAFFPLILVSQMPIPYLASVTGDELSNANAIFRSF